LLVGDEEGKLMGIVSAYDLQTKMEGIKAIQEISLPADFYLHESATAKDALIAITGARFGIIPVVDDGNRIIGIVTRSSLLTVFADHWAGRQEA
jgi:osmoprotectant transport system ATP-binding protein